MEDTTIGKILHIIESHGSATRAEIRDELESKFNLSLTKDHVAAFLTKLSTPRATLPKRIYIKDYVYDADGERCYPRPVYAIGDLKDKKRPGNRSVQLKRGYRSLERARIASVFQLGQKIAGSMSKKELAEALG